LDLDAHVIEARLEGIATDAAAHETASAEDLRGIIKDRKEMSRRALVSLLDHLDALPERARLPVLAAMHHELARTVSLYLRHVTSKFPGPLLRSPRAEAYSAGKADGVFRDSLFGS
jgi:hypothetical protein